MTDATGPTPPFLGAPALSGAAPGGRAGYLLRLTRAEQWWEQPEDPITWPQLRDASARVGLDLRRVGHADCEWRRPVPGWGLEPVLGGSLLDGVVTVVGSTTEVPVAKRMTRMTRLLGAELQGESGEVYALFPVLTPRQAAASGRRTPLQRRSTAGSVSAVVGLLRALGRRPV